MPLKHVVGLFCGLKPLYIYSHLRKHYFSNTNLARFLRYLSLLAGSIARSANRRLFHLLRSRFDLFRPTGATRCTDRSEIWHGGGDQRGGVPSFVLNFIPIVATIRV